MVETARFGFGLGWFQSRLISAWVVFSLGWFQSQLIPATLIAPADRTTPAA
jgi:hypothetical protein